MAERDATFVTYIPAAALLPIIEFDFSPAPRRPGAPGPAPARVNSPPSKKALNLRLYNPPVIFSARDEAREGSVVSLLKYLASPDDIF